jgi:hypothetical protein
MAEIKRRIMFVMCKNDISPNSFAHLLTYWLWLFGNMENLALQQWQILAAAREIACGTSGHFFLLHCTSW